MDKKIIYILKSQLNSYNNLEIKTQIVFIYLSLEILVGIGKLSRRLKRICFDEILVVAMKFHPGIVM
jgi:hypothetical protein